ncbi:multicomponent Na+:H+ antiporter subunit G [Roseomonas alkaliterrae]|uniref:Multicomponent Na+:H+ antiporter subunit G n=1 Tax=Neoroseomonas alkaliterrae TaxID=1452450 RepID=A0A840YCM0_9PROT|nr:monovalent cation/H(+) antiporter subunit G [Neoroseomonas alkaliterrae]MBB5691644.1 multicomponent Na+:H+ antiporter subunit G [Neoroseomonas alkaliterrae]
MSLLADAFTILAILAGIGFFAAGTAGLLRFPDTASRLHALTKADHLGLGLVVIGLLPQAGSLANTLRLLAVWALVLVASAAAGPMLATLTRRAEPET